MIARVFPTKTSMSPDDEHAYFGDPPFNTFYDEVHISCSFTWDIGRAKALMKNWKDHCNTIKIGGPAINGSRGDFVSGMYLKKGITITSRGCPNNCSFCFVQKYEGKIRELPIVEGNIIQDNNILACSPSHLNKVFKMLEAQKAIEFKGGLEANLITPEIAARLRQLSIKSIWIACDTPASLRITERAINILHGVGFTVNHIYCYVLIGKDIAEEENRMRKIFRAGATPFAQLFRNEQDDIFYSKRWRKFQKIWSRPAIIRARMKDIIVDEDV